MTNRPRFRFCAYWGTWSLVLSTRFRVGARDAARPCNRTVEIDLTPANGWGFTEKSDQKIRDLNLRVHATDAGARDRWANDLPTDVEVALRREIGDDLADWVLDPATEILGIVNWAKHSKLSNGGAPLRASAWGHHAHLVPQTLGLALAA